MSRLWVVLVAILFTLGFVYWTWLVVRYFGRLILMMAIK